jgi:hypothetical protein
MATIDLSSALVSVTVPDIPSLKLPPSAFSSDPATLTQDENTAEFVRNAFGVSRKLKAVSLTTIVLHVLKGQYLETWKAQQDISSSLGGINFTPDYAPANYLWSFDDSVIEKIDMNANGEESYGTITLHAWKYVNTGTLGG